MSGLITAITPDGRDAYGQITYTIRGRFDRAKSQSTVLGTVLWCGIEHKYVAHCEELVVWTDSEHAAIACTLNAFNSKG